LSPIHAAKFTSDKMAFEEISLEKVVLKSSSEFLFLKI